MVTRLTTVLFLHHRPEDGKTTSRKVGANIPFEQAEVCLEVPFFLLTIICLSYHLPETEMMAKFSSGKRHVKDRF
jgi:hypothetical protein